MPYPLPLTRTEAYLAYKAGVIQQSDLKPSLAVPRNGIDAWLAYWTGLAEDYPKREDGNPHILQEEEAYIAYLCGVLDEYPEKCLRRVGAYLRYIISARWGRPDHPLNREELYLSLIKTQFIPSGDPSSDIVIDGTAKAPFVDVKMYGDTYQQSYTGKNLCGGTLAQIKNRNTGGTWNGNSYTQAGITWTVYENADGTIDRIEASGQATENGKTFYVKSFNRQQFEEQLGTEETYTLSGCPQGGSSGYYVRVASIPWKTMLTDRGSAATGKLIPSDGYSAVFVILCVDTNAGQVNNLVFRPQLELGSTATSYEPYVGGQPSPNPDYPQPIQTVTGEQTVTVVGKNLFDKTKVTNGYYIDANGVLQASGNFGYSDYIPVIAGQTYTYSGATNNSSYAGKGAWYDANKQWLSSQSFGGSGQITAPTGAAYYRTTIRIVYSSNQEPYLDTYQLELGSTASSYTPYSKHTYPINLGKNLFDKNNATISHFYPHVSEIRQNDSAVSIVLPVEAGTTYTASTTNRSLLDSTPAVACTDHLVTSAPDSFLSRTKWGSDDSVSFTAPAGAKYMYIYVKWTTDATAIANVLATIQVEKGSQATTYAPYFTPIELCKIGDYQDYIYKDGDDWKLHKETHSVTLTGAEYWQHPNVGSSASFFQLSNSSWEAVFGNGTLAPTPGTNVSVDPSFFKSTKLVGISALDNNMKIQQGVGKKGIWFRISLLNTWNVSTVEQLQTWLSNHNVPVTYVLATATDTAITNQALIDQLNALKNGGAENGTTYIKVNATDPNLPGLLVVEAPKYE